MAIGAPTVITPGYPGIRTNAEIERVLKRVRVARVLQRSREIFSGFHSRFFQKGGEANFTTKNDGSLASCFEKKVEKLIGSYLRAMTPDIAIYGEEGFVYQPEKTENHFRWLMDPVDGSIAFRNRLDTYGFVLALVYNQEPIATTLFFPQIGRSYEAYLGGGAWCGEKRLSMPDIQVDSHGIIAISDDYTFQMVGREGVLGVLRSSDYLVRHCTDAYGHSLMAEGKCLMKFDAACAAWDRFPVELLAREAGALTEFYPIERPTDDLQGSLVICHPDFADERDRILKQTRLK